MTNNPESHDQEHKAGITRRTVVKGAAWAAPVIAVAAVVPDASASLPPCVGSVASSGGTYPVNVGLGGCNVSGTHWDFQFKIGALASVGCNCKYVRVTFKDSPNRSQLWLDQNNDQPQRYVQKVLAIGNTGTFPAQGDQVKNVSNNNVIGTIEAPGLTQDSLHTLINASGTGTPPSGNGCNDTNTVMATYEVECGQSEGGPFSPFPNGAGIGSINICVPLITATVCNLGNGNRRLNITVSNSCGIGNGDFVVKNVQRNDDTNFPNQGSSAWTGSQVVGAGTFIDISGGGNSQFWISFTTDGGANISRVRIPNTPTC